MARMTGTTISRKGRSDTGGAQSISPEARQRMILEAAYYRFVNRGFVPGHDVEDWLAAEAELERVSLRRQAPEPDTIPDLDLQHNSTLSPREDEALKRIIKQHPRRDIPRIESMEPEDAPLKE